MQDGRIEVPVKNKMKLMRNAETLLHTCQNALEFLEMYPGVGSKTKRVVAWEKARPHIIQSIEDVIKGAQGK